MGAFGILYGFIQSAGYFSAAGSTPAERIAFGHQMTTIARSLTYLLPLPVGLGTIGGYLQWRVGGALPILFGFWALLSSTGATRGDEEHGLVELWLSEGVGRVRYLTDRVLGFALASAVAIAATWIVAGLGAARGGSALGSGPLAAMSVAVLAIVLVCYGVGLVVAQVTATRGAAAGVGGIVLLVLFFINSFSRSAHSLRPLARVVSPFYYYDRSTPLAPGGSLDVPGTVGLLVAALALATVAAWLMRRRDLGSPLFRRRPHEGPIVERPDTNPLLRMPVASALYEQRWGLLAWAAGTAIATVVVASVGRQLVDLAKNDVTFQRYLAAGGHGDPYVALTGYFWLGIFQLLLVAYAITRVARWSSDDSEGRLEMELSEPVSRTRVVAERALALLAGTVFIIAVDAIAFYFGTHSQNINLHPGDLVTAAVVLIPFALSFAAVGMLLTSWVPRQTVAILATLAFLSYLITEGGPLLKWPDWVFKLSAFSLYGTPLTSGVYWTGLWVLLGVTVIGFGLGSVLMQRRDVGS